MSRMLKAGALSLATLAATLSLGVAVAGAEQYKFSASPTTLSGSQISKNRFQIPGAGTVECGGVNYAGTALGTSTSMIELHPEYSGCIAFGLSAHITTTGCNFRLWGPSSHFALVDFTCGASKIKITPTFFGASVCTIEIGTQTPAGSALLFNNGSKTDFSAEWTLWKIAHTAGCGAGAANDAEYRGQATIGGSNSVWFE